MKKYLAVIALVSTVALSGCSPDPEPKQGPVAEATDHSNDITESKRIPPKTDKDLGDGIKNSAAPVASKPPIDKGLELALPGLNSVDVSPNEKVKLNTSGLQAKRDVEAVIFYYSKGDNDAKISLGKAKADDKGVVIMDVVVPADLAPGKYSIGFVSEDGIANNPIVVK